MQVQLDVQLALAGDATAMQRLTDIATEPGSAAVDAGMARGGLAEIAIRAGRYDDALTDINAMTRLADTASPLPQGIVIIRATAVVLRLWTAQASGAGSPEADRLAAAQLRLAREPALSQGDIPNLGAWTLAGAELAGHRGADDEARELWSLALRLSARAVYPFQDGYTPQLTAILGEPADREAAQAPWRSQPASAVIARARELMTALLD
jgi:hypothetical protein